MRWFRAKVRQGSWLALFALAINLALSFGHVHAVPGHSDAGLVVQAAAALSGNGGQSQDNDRHPDDLCPICMAAAALHSAMASTPPALPIEFASTSVEHAIATRVAIIEPRRAGFNSRGPPVS
jgi:hypothetical protein